MQEVDEPRILFWSELRINSQYASQRFISANQNLEDKGLYAIQVILRNLRFKFRKLKGKTKKTELR